MTLLMLSPQTPLMPLIPTLAITFSSVLLLSAGELVGLIEVMVILTVGELSDGTV